MALHTAGDLLNWHPHIHAIAVNGVVADDGAFLSLSNIDVEWMTTAFRDKIFQALLDEQLIDQETVDNMNSWEHSGFHGYAGEPISGNDENARLFLARYLKKSPVSLERIHIKDTLPVPSVVYFKQQDDGDELYRAFSPLEFLAELQQHIPDIWEQTSRFFGCYASRTRGAEARKKRLRETLDKPPNELILAPEAEPAKPPSRTWTACMKRVFEINPLLCPKCSGQMKILAFLQNQREIKKIADCLGLVTWRAPPPFAANASSATPRTNHRAELRIDTSPEFSQIH